MSSATIDLGVYAAASAINVRCNGADERPLSIGMPYMSSFDSTYTFIVVLNY